MRDARATTLNRKLTTRQRAIPCKQRHCGWEGVPWPVRISRVVRKISPWSVLRPTDALD
jgi:hypothetical protein